MSREQKMDVVIAFSVLFVVFFIGLFCGRAFADDYSYHLTKWQSTKLDLEEIIAKGRCAYEFRQQQRNIMWEDAWKKADWRTRHFGDVCPNCPIPEDKTTYTAEQQKECDEYIKSVFGS